jgi:hypothetical protein
MIPANPDWSEAQQDLYQTALLLEANGYVWPLPSFGASGVCEVGTCSTTTDHRIGDTRFSRMICTEHELALDSLMQNEDPWSRPSR